MFQFQHHKEIGTGSCFCAVTETKKKDIFEESPQNPLEKIPGGFMDEFLELGGRSEEKHLCRNASGARGRERRLLEAPEAPDPAGERPWETLTC